jgi:predicted DNA-binding transcriptional regulator AlpA
MDLEQLQNWGLEPLISVDELAAYLGLPKQTIYQEVTESLEIP